MRFHEINDIPVHISEVYLFISFEERCLTVANYLYESGFSGIVRAFYCMDSYAEALEVNRSKLIKMFPKCEWIPVSYRDPLPMVLYCRKMDRNIDYLLDISCFNRENLFTFLWASQIGRVYYPSVCFSYCSPKTYGPWLSAKYDRARNLLGFSGSDEPLPKRHLICCVGYESERAVQVIEAIEPSSVTLVLGSTPTRAEFLERNQAAVEEVMGSSNYNIKQINVVDPNSSYDDLLSIVNELPQYTSIHFATFNTKVSCLAAFSLWLKRPDIRIWNSTPKLYNPCYSDGSHPPKLFQVKWHNE